MKYAFFITALLILAGCGADPQRDLVITFDEIRGLEEGDYVIMRKQDIGEVTAIEFSDDYQMNVHIHLDKVSRLPKDSKFIIGQGSLFSDALYVVPGKSKAYLSNKDRIRGKAVKQIDWGKEFDELIDESVKKPAQTQDSVLDELRGIKEEIHEVNEKTR